MRYVNFIKSLNVERIPLTGRDMTYYSQNFTLVDDNGEPAFLHTQEQVTIHTIPINLISHVNTEKPSETYIAYSKEVEELIEIPFMAIKEELYQAYTHKRKIETATWINRLQYLFTGNLK